MPKILCACCAAVVSAAVGAALTEVDVKSTEEEAKRISAELAALRQENRMLEVRREALATTAELIAGERKSPPKPVVEEVEVRRPFGAGRVLDNRASGEPLVAKEWLKQLHPGRYRAKARLTLKEAKDLRNFKFGCMIPVPGSGTRWPAALVGGTPFAEREMSFDFDVPPDSCVLLLIGFESGTGLAEFRDVRICELKETLK